MRTMPHVARSDVHCQCSALGPRAPGCDCHSHRPVTPPSPALPGVATAIRAAVIRRQGCAGTGTLTPASPAVSSRSSLAACAGDRSYCKIKVHPVCGAADRRQAGTDGRGRYRRRRRRPGCRSCGDGRRPGPGRHGRCTRPTSRIAGPGHDNAPRGTSRQGATMRTVPHVARSDVHCQHPGSAPQHPRPPLSQGTMWLRAAQMNCPHQVPRRAPGLATLFCRTISRTAACRSSDTSATGGRRTGIPVAVVAMFVLP